MTQPRAARVAAELTRMQAFFPIMQLLGNRLAATRPFDGLRIGMSAHLTTHTAALVQELRLGGGEWIICAASGATTDQGVVELLRANGVHVYTSASREDHHLQVLDHRPNLLAEAGGNLVGTLLRKCPDQIDEVRGAVELSRTGLNRLRESGLKLPFPLLNITEGRLKPAIENRHGVGEGLWHAVQQLTGVHLSGRRVGVVGYGPVGRGVAAYARAAGAMVSVVEAEPVRRLVAHYDGYPTPDLIETLQSVEFVVTATGRPGAIHIPEILQARNGIVLMNAGTGDQEIDVEGIRSHSVGFDQIGDHVTAYHLESGPRVVLLAGGHPLNIVMNAGSPEPVLLHFTALGLSMSWLLQANLSPGEHIVPVEVERDAARLALKALGQDAR
jgi:adenosylhomocysteinase